MENGFGKNFAIKVCVWPIRNCRVSNASYMDDKPGMEDTLTREFSQMMIGENDFKMSYLLTNANSSNKGSNN